MVTVLSSAKTPLRAATTRNVSQRRRAIFSTLTHTPYTRFTAMVALSTVAYPAIRICFGMIRTYLPTFSYLTFSHDELFGEQPTTMVIVGVRKT